MTSKASLHVRVLNQNRQPVKDALITANNRTALSDDNGRATLAVTFPATVTVQKSGSSTQTRTLQQADQQHQTFFLAPPTVVTYTVGQTVIPLAAPPDMLIAVLQSYVTEALAEDGYLTTLLSSLNIPLELLWSNYEAFLKRGLLPLQLNPDEKTLHLETSATKLIDDLAKTLLEKKEIASVGQPVYIQGDQCAFLTASALVKLRTNTNETTIDTLCTRHGFTNPKLLVKDLNVYQLDYTGQADLTLLAATSALNAEPEVVYCEPNLASTVHENSVGHSLLEPANALFKQQWDHRIIRTPQAWSFLQKLDNSKTFGSDTVRIVVIDTYFDQAKMKAHPSFKGKNVEICNIPTSARESSHGIACAGAASALTVSPPATHNGPAGIAGNCRLTAIGIGDSIQDNGYLNVLQWIGGTSFKGMPSPPSATERVIVSQSVKFVSESETVKGQIKTLSENPAGPLFFVAAGNETRFPYFLNDLANSTGVCFIAASTVSNGIEKIAEYSNYGDGIFCCAPSGHCLPPPPPPLKKEILAIAPIHELKLTEGKVYYAVDPDFGVHLYRLNFSGTSYSTPVVAGIAALMLTANPYLSWQQVKTILAETSDKICNSSETYSTNPLAPYQDLPHSQKFGHGRVNAETAVKHASFIFDTPQIIAVAANRKIINLTVQNCWPGTLSLSVNSTDWTLPNGPTINFPASLNGTSQTLQIVVQRNNSSTTTGELTIYHELSGQAFTVSLT